jgi:hypothetical protein
MASRSTSVARLRNEGSFRLSSGASSHAGSQSNLAKMNEENPRTETYAKFDEYQSSFYSHLPAELNKLRSSGEDLFDAILFLVGDIQSQISTTKSTKHT